MSAGSPSPADIRRILPNDAVRAILWRFEHRDDLQALVLAARHAAHGPLALAGPRTAGMRARRKVQLERALEAAGVGSAAIDGLAHSAAGGAAALGLALVAFELAWADAGPAAAAVGLRVPAGDIVGGSPILGAVEDAPGASGHRPASEARRRKVAVGIMTAAKLLSAIEPVLTHRAVHPFDVRNGAAGEDAAHRVVDIWAAGEAAAALGFEAARTLDQVDTVGKLAGATGAAREGARAGISANARRDALTLLAERARPAEKRNAGRIDALKQDAHVSQALLESLADVLCPAVKLWNTGHGANVLREAVSLMGGDGLAPDGPGALAYKWLDAQVEAASDGSESVQRALLAGSMVDDLFLAQYRGWVDDMRQVASDRPGTGACLLASVMQMWLWTLQHLRKATGFDGRPLFLSERQGVTFPMADALCWILTSHQQILDVFELERRGAANPAAAWLPGQLPLLTDLCHVQAARAAGEVGRICAEVLYGYRPHPAWDRDGCATCYVADELEALDDVIPGMGAAARFYGDVIETDGTHPAKAGPCAHTDGLEPFLRMRTKVDGCLTGCRVAKDRAADALAAAARAES